MANETTAAPIVVQSSQRWEGNDGPWSTFDLHIGTPPQPVRVLISSVLGETLVVSANETQGGCIKGQDPSSCAQSRGALFNVNKSSTWQDQGLYGVGVEENLPDYIGNYDVADYGKETVGLGLPGSNSITEPNLIVGALATKDFYLGYLGLTNQPTNFSQFEDPQPSFLSTLKAQNKIPSLSYAYSAGAPYRFKKVEGTLTLGGYDASKFTPNDVDFRFASDISRDLVVGLQSITFSNSTTTDQQLLPDGILTFIDSTVPGIWLPQDACTLFEDAFGVTYNDTAERYLVDDTLHEKLQSQDASVSFVLGNDVNGGPTVNITLPYSAFDLQVSGPIVNNTQNYFPLRRAVNNTQYTLGRTFLQEAYLVVNYERSNFSVFQNSWIDNAPQHIIPIRSINSTTPSNTHTPEKSSGISIGAIVGIIVAAVLLVLLAAVATFLIIRRRRKRRREAEKKDEDDDPYRKPEMDGNGKPLIGELYNEHKLGEVDSSSKVEMQGSQPGFSDQDKKTMAEIEGSRGGVEVEGTTGGMEMEGSHLRAEMAGDHLAPVELDAGPQGLHELPSPNTSNSELPSPLSSNNGRRSGQSATWNRRQKPTPRLPNPESSDVSADAEPPSRTNGAGMRSGRTARGAPPSLSPHDISSATSKSRDRRPGQPSPNLAPSRSPDNRHLQPATASQRNAAFEIPSRSTSPTEVSSQSSGSREHQRHRGNALDRHMDAASNRASPLGISSPSDQSLRRTDSAEEWNRRFKSRERSLTPRSPDAWSPVSPSDRNPSNESGEMVERRRPSPLGNIPGSGTPRANPPAQGVPREGSPQPPGNYF